MKELITYNQANKICLSKTNEAMMFKAQFLPKDNYFLLGKKIKIIDLAFTSVYWIEYENKRYFISEVLIK